VKSMQERDARPLTGGDRLTGEQTGTDPSAAVSPVFSPDSQSIAFQAGGGLRRIAVSGGSAVPIIQTSGTVYGVAWAEDGIYYVEPSNRAIDGPNRLRRVSPSGRDVLTLAESKNDEQFFGPQPLPQGRGVLITRVKGLATSRWDQAQVLVLLPSGESRVVVESGSDGRYLPNGVLSYSTGGIVFGAPFDLNLLRMTAPPAPIVDGVTRGFPTTSASQYSVSSSGTLAYVPGPLVDSSAGRSLGIFGTDGSAVLLSEKPDQYEFPRASHDGKHLAVDAYDGREGSIWILPLDDSSDRRRLPGGGINRFPIWSPDDRQLAFQSDSHGAHGIFWQASDARGSAQRITTAEAGIEQIPAVWAPDGASILFEQVKDGRYSLWSADVKSGKQVPLIERQSQAPLTPAFSPNGKWLAYHTRDISNGSARDTVWVRPFPVTTDAWEVSSEGSSHHPVWLANDELLMVVGAGQIVVRGIKTLSGVEVGKSRVLALTVPTSPPATFRSFDLLPNGHIVSNAEQGLRPSGAAGAASLAGIDVVQNWFEEVKQKVQRAR
jgi:Tol biopolymer transport system component